MSWKCSLKWSVSIAEISHLSVSVRSPMLSVEQLMLSVALLRRLSRGFLRRPVSASACRSFILEPISAASFFLALACSCFLMAGRP